jgi:hypothetical protein
MSNIRSRLILPVAIATLLLRVTSACADDTSNTLFEKNEDKLTLSTRKWKQNDDCGKESFRKYPDYTAEGAIKREAYMRQCLLNHHLPPRSDLTKWP